jgi:hypothetical protein
MHDWIFLSVVFEWASGRATLRFRSALGEEALVASSVVDLHVPQLNEWGPSVSVNAVKGPFSTNDGRRSLEIEMQSGDVITIVAQSFQMPMPRTSARDVS